MVNQSENGVRSLCIAKMTNCYNIQVRREEKECPMAAHRYRKNTRSVLLLALLLTTTASVAAEGPTSTEGGHDAEKPTNSVDTVLDQVDEYISNLRNMRLTAEYRLFAESLGDFRQVYDVTVSWPRKMAIRRREGNMGGDIIYDGHKVDCLWFLSGDYRSEIASKDWLLELVTGHGTKEEQGAVSILDNAGWGPATVLGMLAKVLAERRMLRQLQPSPYAVDTNQLSPKPDLKYLALELLDDGRPCHHLRAVTRDARFDLWFEADTRKLHRLSWRWTVGDDELNLIDDKAVEESKVSRVEVRLSDWATIENLPDDEFVFTPCEAPQVVDAGSQRLLRRYSRALWEAESLTADAEFVFESPETELRQTYAVVVKGRDRFAVRRQSGEGGGQIFANDRRCHLFSFNRNQFEVTAPPRGWNEWTPFYESAKQSAGVGTAAVFLFLRNGFYGCLLESSRARESSEVSFVEPTVPGDSLLHLKANIGPYAAEFWFTDEARPRLNRVVLEPFRLGMGPKAPPSNPRAEWTGKLTIKYSNWQWDVGMDESAFEFVPPDGASEAESRRTR